MANILKQSSLLPTQAPDEAQVFRNCILCSKDVPEILFTFTFDFLTQVRGESPDRLKKIGWTPDTISSIVKCKACGAKYIRDVFTNYEEIKEEHTETQIEERRKTQHSHKLFPQSGKRSWILSNLFEQAHRHFGRNISLLDYGAGTGQWSNHASAVGISSVYAYEPFAPFPPHLYAKFNFPGIIASRNWDTIAQHSPFDTIVCNAVFEHIIEPRKNVERLFDHLSSGGFLYLHNPFMNLNKELKALKAAKQISKQMPISHYHPGHVNYLTPDQFKQFVTNIGFKTIPLLPNPFPQTLGKQIKNLAKSTLIKLNGSLSQDLLLQKP